MSEIDLTSLSPHEQLKAAWEFHKETGASLFWQLCCDRATGTDDIDELFRQHAEATQIAVSIAEDFTRLRKDAEHGNQEDYQHFLTLYGFAPEEELQRFIRGEMGEAAANAS